MIKKNKIQCKFKVGDYGSVDTNIHEYALWFKVLKIHQGGINVIFLKDNIRMYYYNDELIRRDYSIHWWVRRLKPATVLKAKLLGYIP